MDRVRGGENSYSFSHSFSRKGVVLLFSAFAWGGGGKESDRVAGRLRCGGGEAK